MMIGICGCGVWMYQNLPLLLFLRWTWRVFLILLLRLSFFMRLSTCLTLRLSLPLPVLLLLLTTYFLLSLSWRLDLSQSLLTWRSLLYSVTPSWLMRVSACFCVFFSFFCTLSFLRTFASRIFLGTRALMAISLAFSCWNSSFVMGAFLKLCFCSSSANHLGRLSWSQNEYLLQDPSITSSLARFRSIFLPSTRVSASSSMLQSSICLCLTISISPASSSPSSMFLRSFFSFFSWLRFSCCRRFSMSEEGLGITQASSSESSPSIFSLGSTFTFSSTSSSFSEMQRSSSSISARGFLNSTSLPSPRDSSSMACQALSCLTSQGSTPNLRDLSLSSWFWWRWSLLSFLDCLASRICCSLRSRMYLRASYISQRFFQSSWGLQDANFFLWSLALGCQGSYQYYSSSIALSNTSSTSSPNWSSSEWCCWSASCDFTISSLLRSSFSLSCLISLLRELSTSRSRSASELFSSSISPCSPTASSFSCLASSWLKWCLTFPLHFRMDPISRFPSTFRSSKDSSRSLGLFLMSPQYLSLSQGETVMRLYSAKTRRGLSASMSLVRGASLQRCMGALSSQPPRFLRFSSSLSMLVISPAS